MKSHTSNVYFKRQLLFFFPGFEVYFQKEFVKEVLETINHRCFNNSKSVHVNTHAHWQCIPLWVAVSNEQNKYSLCKQSIKTDTRFLWFGRQEDIKYPPLITHLILRLTFCRVTVLWFLTWKNSIIIILCIRTLSTHKNSYH